MAECLCLSLPNKMAVELQIKAHEAGLTKTSYIRELVREHLAER